MCECEHGYCPLVVGVVLSVSVVADSTVVIVVDVGCIVNLKKEGKIDSISHQMLLSCYQDPCSS